MRATRAIIYLNYLRSNLNIIKETVGPGVKICLAVKADAYGHGVIPVVQTALEEGIDAFGVATVDEGLEIRQAGLKATLLLFSLPVPAELPTLVSENIIPFVAGLDLIERLEQEAERQRKQVAVHLKVDTGMGRIGCSPADAPDLARTIAGSPWLTLAGICTHYPGADMRDEAFTLHQLALFQDVVAKIQTSGVHLPITHTANSGAIIGYPPSLYNLARPGIMAYGYYPSDEQARQLALKPVMELVTKVVFIKTVEAGTPLSYGMTYRTRQKTKIATLAVGYGDGYSRLLSNCGEVAMGGKRYPVVGRVCMDQCLVDIGLNSDVRLYDDVVLFGPHAPAPDAEELAARMKTIPYEVTCLVSKRVPRVFQKS
jgi:alanine racemase